MADRSPLQPEQSLVESVAKEMGDVLLRSPLRPDADFFGSGGDSLRAVGLVARLTERWRPGGGESADALYSALLLSIFDDQPSPTYIAQVISEHADG